MKLIKNWMGGIMPFIFTALILTPILSFADVPVVPDSDPLALVLQLIMQWKTMGPLAGGMLVVMILTQVIKKFAPEFKYKRLLVTALSCVYGVILGVSQGLPVLSVLVAVLVTGGGAVAIYNAFQGVGETVANAKAKSQAPQG